MEIGPKEGLVIFTASVALVCWFVYDLIGDPTWAIVLLASISVAWSILEKRGVDYNNLIEKSYVIFISSAAGLSAFIAASFVVLLTDTFYTTWALFGSVAFVTCMGFTACFQWVRSVNREKASDIRKSLMNSLIPSLVVCVVAVLSTVLLESYLFQANVVSAASTLNLEKTRLGNFERYEEEVNVNGFATIKDRGEDAYMTLTEDLIELEVYQDFKTINSDFEDDVKYLEKMVDPYVEKDIFLDGEIVSKCFFTDCSKDTVLMVKSTLKVAIKGFSAYSMFSAISVEHDHVESGLESHGELEEWMENTRINNTDRIVFDSETDTQETYESKLWEYVFLNYVPPKSPNAQNIEKPSDVLENPKVTYLHTTINSDGPLTSIISDQRISTIVIRHTNMAKHIDNMAVDAFNMYNYMLDGGDVKKILYDNRSNHESIDSKLVRERVLYAKILSKKYRNSVLPQ